MEEDIRRKYFTSSRAVKTKQGHFDFLNVEVLKRTNEERFKIGTYKRNYTHLLNTFCPFTLNGKDYALYSPSYSQTRVMSLPDCKDIGGEEIKPEDKELCPIDYYVPVFRKKTIVVEGKEADFYLIDDECFSQEQLTGKIGAVSSCNFGFAAYVLWGGSEPAEIHCFDLSQVDKGIIKRDRRFGNIALPRWKRLKDIIDMEDWSPGGMIRISHEDTFMQDGKKIDW